MSDTNYEVPHCGAFTTPHSHPSWAQIFTSWSCFQIPTPDINIQYSTHYSCSSTSVSIYSCYKSWCWLKVLISDMCCVHHFFLPYLEIDEYMLWNFQGHCLAAAFWFTVLLNMKHIFIYVAPAYFVYLLRSYCFPGYHGGASVHWKTFSPIRFAKLGLVVASVFLVSFGPFIVLNQLSQVRFHIVVYIRKHLARKGPESIYMWIQNEWKLEVHICNKLQC